MEIPAAPVDPQIKIDGIQCSKGIILHQHDNNYASCHIQCENSEHIQQFSQEHSKELEGGHTPETTVTHELNYDCEDMEEDMEDDSDNGINAVSSASHHLTHFSPGKLAVSMSSLSSSSSGATGAIVTHSAPIASTQPSAELIASRARKYMKPQPHLAADPKLLAASTVIEDESVIDTMVFQFKKLREDYTRLGALTSESFKEDVAQFIADLEKGYLETLQMLFIDYNTAYKRLFSLKKGLDLISKQQRLSGRLPDLVVSCDSLLTTHENSIIQAYMADKSERNRRLIKSTLSYKTFSKLHSHSIVLSDKNDLQAAYTLQLQCVAGFGIHCPGTLDEAAAMGNCGHICLKMGRYLESIKYCTDCLNIQNEKIPNNADVAKIVGVVAGSYSGLRNVEESEKNYRLAIKILKLHYEDSSEEARFWTNMGNLFRDNNLDDKALEAYEEGLRIHRKIDPFGLDVASVSNSIGNIYRKQEKLAESLRYYETALNIERQVAPGSVDEAATLLSLGHMYRQQGNNDEALKYYEEFLRMTQYERRASDFF